jgi:D-sedoheptulose 7-phosphate isomerase
MEPPLSTPSANPLLREHQTKGCIEAYRDRVTAIIAGIDVGAIERVVDRLHRLWSANGLLAIAGNGGSATTASHMATDLALATRVSGERAFRVVSLTTNQGLISALGNDRGFGSVFADQLECLIGPGDAFLAISASGNSDNVVLAAERAREIGAATIALVGFTGGRLAEICDNVVHVSSDIGEYGPVEDAHLVLEHMITAALHARIKADTEGR